MSESARAGQADIVIIGGDPRVKPTKRRCLRDPNWTEISDREFREHAGRYVKTGTLTVNNEEITFYDFNF